MTNYDREEIWLQQKMRDAEASFERMQRDFDYKVRQSKVHKEAVNYGDLKAYEVVIVMSIILIGFSRLLGLI